MEQPQAAPMDGASPASNEMGEDPMMGGNPAMGGDPAMGSDPAMDGEDPMMGGDPAMGDNADDSTVSIINQLSPEDKEAVRAYAESMLNRAENPTAGSDSMGGEEPPMMESVIFTKKQLKTLTESFIGDNKETEDDKKQLNPKKAQNVSKKSPFNSPKFK